jgi:hypothetical protein
MTSLRCGTAIRILPIFGLLILAATSLAQTRPPTLEKVAKTYGLDSWDKIEAIRYTWNIEFGKMGIPLTQVSAISSMRGCKPKSIREM